MTSRLLLIKEQRIKLHFHQLEMQRETKFLYKIKEDRDPENIALDLLSKKDIVKEMTTQKRKQLKEGKSNNDSKPKNDEIQAMLNQTINTTRMMSQKSNHQRNVSLENKPTTNIESHRYQSFHRQSNSMVYNGGSKLEMSNSVNNETYVELLKNMKQNNSRLSLNISKSDANLLNNKLIQSIDNAKKSVMNSSVIDFKDKNLTEKHSMTHLPYLPTRRRIVYDTESMRSNLKEEINEDVQIVENIIRSNRVTLLDRTKTNKNANFHILTPIEMVNVNKPNYNFFKKNSRQIVVNSTFTETVYNNNDFKSLVIKVNINRSPKKQKEDTNL
jgi:hypothetical protein